jgi:hypothetical protein
MEGKERRKRRKFDRVRMYIEDRITFLYQAECTIIFS